MVTNKNLFANDKVCLGDETGHLNQLYTGIQRYSRFLTRNNWDADDLVQEALLKAIQHYHPSEVTSSLLNKIAYHYWIDTIRKKRHEVVENLEDVSGREDTAKSDGMLDAVNLLVNHLTPKQAVIILLKEAFRYQVREIADLLGTTEMAVKSTLHRAKKRLEKVSLLQTVDSFWSKEERDLLFDLMYKSLQAEDPAILLDCISEIPSLVEVPKLAKHTHSVSPLNVYSLAA